MGRANGVGWGAVGCGAVGRVWWRGGQAPRTMQSKLRSFRMVRVGVRARGRGRGRAHDAHQLEELENLIAGIRAGSAHLVRGMG